jgi:sterol 3beta-glucosyltransferase
VTDMSTSATHIAVILYGSRGDIQPGVCLALELLERGHRVSVAVPPNLVAFARALGAGEVYSIGVDTHTAWSSDEAADSRRRSPIARLRYAVTTVRDGFAAFDRSLTGLFLDDRAPLADADVVVAAPLCQDRALAITERLGIALVVLRFGPMSENGVLGAVPGWSDSWSPDWKRRSWRFADRVTWLATGWNEMLFRRRLGLPPVFGPLPKRLAAQGIRQIQAYDQEIVPGIADEWGPLRPVVGFFDLSSRDRLALDESGGDSSELMSWLDAGEQPVFVSFGSMPIDDPDRLIGIFAGAAAELGYRVLFSLGPRRGRDATDPGIYYTGAVDHSAILPRCCAVVHHGGAGTTAAGLRAGLPTMICAVTADQPFWAARIRALGVGYGTRLGKVTDEIARIGLRTILDPEIVCTTQQLADRLAAPDTAVAAAAAVVEAEVVVHT